MPGGRGMSEGRECQTVGRIGVTGATYKERV